MENTVQVQVWSRKILFVKEIIHLKTIQNKNKKTETKCFSCKMIKIQIRLQYRRLHTTKCHINLKLPSNKLAYICWFLSSPHHYLPIKSNHFDLLLLSVCIITLTRVADSVSNRFFIILSLSHQNTHLAYETHQVTKFVQVNIIYAMGVMRDFVLL